jgi:IS4 transposase
MHTLLDLRGNIPSVVIITPGNVHDVKILDQLVIEPGAIYIFDRGYVDFARLYRIHQTGAFFVTRAKNNFRFQRLYSRKAEADSIRCDQIIIPQTFYAKKDYPAKLRRIHYIDAETQKHLIFLTNNFSLPATTIADLYRCRWQVELFFKWIKQHLRIKAFYGTTANAVKTQIWIAISVYVLVAIVKKRLNLDQSLYTILQVLSVTLFEKTPILQAFIEVSHTNQTLLIDKQLKLFE